MNIYSENNRRMIPKNKIPNFCCTPPKKNYWDEDRFINTPPTGYIPVVRSLHVSMIVNH